jgi:hypothetical protein
MKTELRAVEHTLRSGETAFEVWHDGQLIASIVGAEGPGVRVFSKHPLKVTQVDGYPNEVEVMLELPDSVP